MTANHEHTPTTSQVLFNYVLMGGSRAGFVRWLAARDARIEAAAEQRGAAPLLKLLEELTDSNDCWFDHHGGCQAHGFISLEPGESCPHQDAKEIIRADQREGDDD